MDQQRESILRAGLAALVVLAVLGLVVIDRQGDDPEQAATAPPTTPPPTSEPTMPLPSTTVAPLPGKRSGAQGQGTKGRRGARGATAVPTPPAGLDTLVCQTLAKPVRLRVLSYNMHRGHGGLARVASEIARTGADIVLLQEVDRNVGLTGRVDQTAYLATRLRMYGVFGANIPRGGGQYGTAVLTRHEVQEWSNTPLPNNRGSEQRGLLRVTLEVAGQRFNVYNTHLQFGPNPIQRVQGAAVSRILGSDPLPRILGGDLNAWPGSRTMRALLGPVRDPWPVVGHGAGGTGPRGGRIDYVLASRDFEAVSAMVVPSRASDHNAVLTELVLPPHTCP
jgi:endonuclease/exonuclease/phosphatase family metal-dependent hydrolase